MDGSAVLNPDGIDANPNSHRNPLQNVTTTIVSLADTAFQTDSNGNVTLIVGVGNTPAPYNCGGHCWTDPHPALKGVVTGAQPAPILPVVNYYPTLSFAVNRYPNSGYTVLDLGLFTATYCPPATCSYPVFDPTKPLLMLLRNTLPNKGNSSGTGAFACSGSAVPFSSAVYTNIHGGGRKPYGTVRATGELRFREPGEQRTRSGTPERGRLRPDSYGPADAEQREYRRQLWH